MIPLKWFNNYQTLDLRYVTRYLVILLYLEDGVKMN